MITEFYPTPFFLFKLAKNFRAEKSTENEVNVHPDYERLLEENE